MVTDVRQAAPTKLGLANANVEGHTPYDIIKVASLIEAEAKVDAGPPADRVGDLQPARGEHAAPDRRDADLRARRSREPHALATPTCRSSRRTTPTAHRAAADADRRGERRVAAGRAGARATRRTSTTCSRDKDGHHAFASTLRAAAAEHRRRRRQAGAAVITGATRVAGVIGDPVRHSLSPRAAQRGVPRARPRLGATSRSRCPTAARRPRSTRCAALGLVGLSVTMPHKTAVGRLLRRAHAPTRPRCAASTR